MVIERARAINRRLSLRGKLIVLLLVVTVAALGSGYGLVVTSNVRLFKAETANAANHFATILAEFAVAPLSFNDAEGAREVLVRLETTPSVEVAAIYDASGELFASFVRRGGERKCPESISAAEPGFTDHYYEAFTAIKFKGDKLGTVLICASTVQLNQKIAGYVVKMTVIFLAVLAVCVLLVLRLTRIITGPISGLAAVAEGVSKRADYSVRVQPVGSDEIGRLYEAFNHMLAKVHERQRERDQAEAKLRESELKYRAIVEDQTELICRYRPDGTILFANGAYLRYFKLSPDDLGEISFFSFLHAEDRYKLKLTLESLNAGNPVGYEELRVVDDDTTRWHQWTIRAILDSWDKVSEWQFVGRDITDLKMAENEKGVLAKQLEHSQRLETIGTLAGGIAHDFNNVLTPIMGCIQLAQLDMDKTSEPYAQLKVALESSARARELVQQILTFSRHTEYKRDIVAVGEIVQQALKLIRASIPKTIQVKTNIDSSCGKISATPTQIHQAIVNLCTNAYQAMVGSGGTLEILVDSVTLDLDVIPPGSGLSPGRYTRVRVRDTGTGISERVKERIFEPFFSTKSSGEGTGLGLSVVHGIVASHGGHVSVESQFGEGSTFTMVFPEEKSRPDAARPSELSAVSGNGRILVVDDEEAITKMVKRMLETLGYGVVATTSPQEALRIFGDDSAGFDAVITDQSMPDMTGMKLAERLVELDKNVRIILASGYKVGTPSDSEMSDLNIVSYLQKPFRIEEISLVLRGAILEST